MTKLILHPHIENAHFSQDILSSLLNESIPGQGIFWSSVKGKPYPIPLRVISFNKIYKAIDKEYKKNEIETFAKKLREKFKLSLQIERKNTITTDKSYQDESSDNEIDVLHTIESKVIEKLQNDSNFKQQVESNSGIAYGKIKAFIKELLPDTLADLNERAYYLVPKVLNEIYGKQDIGWHTLRNAAGKTYVKTGGKSP